MGGGKVKVSVGGGGKVSVFKSKIPPFDEENTKDTKQDVK